MYMDFLSNFGVWGGGWTGWVVPFLFGLGIVVFFHELGHFLVARWVGVRVLVFSVGFGPELAGFTDRYGTRWKLSAIPLGGYVKFFGDQNAASVPDREAAAAMTAEERAQSFVYKSLPRRAAVVVAGPVANFILASVIFAGIFMIYGKPSTTARVDNIVAGSAAEKAGFKIGDVIVAVGDREIQSFDQLQRIVAPSAGRSLDVAVNRGGERVVLKVVPQLVETNTPSGTMRRGVLGISRVTTPEEPGTKSVDPLTAVGLGIEKTWWVIESTLSYLGKVVTGRESPDQLSGVIGIAQVSGQVASLGFFPLLDLAGMLSVSIGLLNLFPIPLLDGGHLLFYALEGLRGRPISEQAQEYGFRFGLVIVLMLMVFATYNDITQRLPWLRWLWS
jgi:regulator of sigma E protease